MGLESATKEAAAQQAAVSCKAVANPVPQKRFRGVTKHRRSGRWEAHIWVREMGRQVYLGGYEHAEHAAEAYDVAALKCKGFKVKTNFDIDRYSNLTESMDSISLEEVIMAVRRQSRGFSRGTSAYRGVTHHPSGRWEARIGIPAKVYLGLFSMETEAAQAYDRALVRLRGTAAATNFALSDYRSDLAAYHKMQQTVLQSDKGVAALPGGSLNFERWIKHGLSPEDLVNSSNDSGELLSQAAPSPSPVAGTGTVAGTGAAPRTTPAKKRTRARSRSRSRSRSPCRNATVLQLSHQHGTTDDDSDDESGPSQVKGCILADLARHLLKAYSAEEQTHARPAAKQSDTAVDLTPSHGRRQADRKFVATSADAEEQGPPAAATAVPGGDLASDASEEISTCSEMQSGGGQDGDEDDTQSDDSMHGHSIVGAETVGADTAQAESRAEHDKLLTSLRQQLSSHQQELQVARAQVAAVQSDLADSRSEVLQLRSQALHNSTEIPDSSCQTAPECSEGEADVQQQTGCGVRHVQLDKVKAELSSANQRCSGYEAKLQTARAQYQEQQRRIVALENVVYDLRLHAC